MADALGLDEVRAHALCNLSIAKRHVGDPTADDDLSRSIEIARAANSVELGRALNNQAMAAVQKGEFREAVALLEEAIAFDEGIGSTTYARFARGSLIGRLVDLGRWDEAIAGADQFIAETRLEPHYQEISVRAARSGVLLARGDVEAADADARIALALARQAKDPQTLVPAIVSRIVIEIVLGHAGTTADLRTEVRSVSARSGGHATYYIGAWWMAHLAGLSADYLEELERGARFGRAAYAFEDGDLDRAADLFQAMGARPNEAYVRLLAAERDVASGDRAAGERQLEQAFAFYREMRATRFIERCEALSVASGRNAEPEPSETST